LHLSHIFFTEGLTFIVFTSCRSKVECREFEKLSYSPLRTLNSQLLISVRYPTAFQIVWRKLHQDLVAGQDANEILSHFA